MYFDFNSCIFEILHLQPSFLMVTGGNELNFCRFYFFSTFFKQNKIYVHHLCKKIVFVVVFIYFLFFAHKRGETAIFFSFCFIYSVLSISLSNVKLNAIQFSSLGFQSVSFIVAVCRVLHIHDILYTAVMYVHFWFARMTTKQSFPISVSRKCI